MTTLRVALIQMGVEKDVNTNLQKAKAKIAEAKAGGAKLISLPECFNSPYGTDNFPKYAESVPDGPSCQILSQAAKEHGIYLVGGSIPEKDNDKLYNTCTVWNPEGELLLKYRKMHMFDIDIPGGITFKESDILSAGHETKTFNIDDIKIGVGICYDLRFEELAKIYRLQGCHMMIYPGAFNMTTGPVHWSLLQRARANDNQLFVCACSPARSTEGYVAWGYSQITSPWGKVITSAEAGEAIVYANLDFDEVATVRQQIPIFKQRRTDVYDTIQKK